MLASLAFHLVLLLAGRPAPILPLPARGGESGGQAIAAVLVPGQRAPVADGVPVGAAPVLTAPAPRQRPSRQAVELPEAFAGRPSAEAADATGQLESGAPSLQPALVAIAADGPSKESLTRYRLDLAREARRFKRCPPLARERGWEGVVVITVAAVPGVLRPSVAVDRSSGVVLLDEEALAMVTRAVHSSP